MNSDRIEENSTFLLPNLKSNTDLKSTSAGQWDIRQSVEFQNVAKSLDFSAGGEDIKSVSSIPNMWARPLSMEMALHINDYPIRRQMVEQWQGMLAALALAEVRGYDIKTKLLELGKLNQIDDFARSLVELLPSPVNSLYSLNGKHPWQDIYVFLWQGKAVGMTSPSTLICPSEEGDWTGLPWWNNGKLGSPVNFLNADEKNQLSLWLERLRRELYNHGGNRSPLNTIAGLIIEFQSSLKNNISILTDVPEETLKSAFSVNPQFFGDELNRGVLKALNTPLKAQPKPSSVRLIPSLQKQNVRELLIIDPNVDKKWNQPPQNIWIHDTTNLTSLNLDALRNKQLIWDVRWIESEKLLMSDFYFIAQENALPGCLLPVGCQLLSYNGQRITPLIPINPILLEYFTPEDLVRKISIESINGNTGVRIVLDLPLYGLDEGKSTQNYRLVREYPISEDNVLSEVPVLELWPNFKADNWQEYYAFYYDGEYGDDTFQVQLPDAAEPHPFNDGRGIYQIARLTEFPAYISCHNSLRNQLGLMLLKTPQQVGKTHASDWTVGVDFGTSFTNVYVNRDDVVTRFSLESLHLMVTESDADARDRVMINYFIPTEPPFPLSSVLTTKKSSRKSDEQTRQVLDGRIYIPKDSDSFKPDDEGIKTYLKWSTENLNFNRLFLKNLALQITAVAAKNDVKKIQWSLSFPSAFSKSDKNRYIRTWQDITKEIQARTGIEQSCPNADDDYFYRTESLAVAQYFADKEGFNLVNSTCIDMGGGSSDISIWEENNLVHQCSVQLAGKDLFSQFLELNPKFLKRHFDVDISQWQNLRGAKFSAKLDVLLRQKGDYWLNHQRDLVAEDKEFQELIQLTAIGTAGLYYYVGILLRVLHTEGRYNKNKITPVYLGGNGSRFLHWLAEGGQFNRNSEANELFSKIMSLASKFDDTHEDTLLSSAPKDEVACGLVLSDSKLTGLTRKDDLVLIAGEVCSINGEPIDWNSRLKISNNEIDSFSVEDKIANFTIPEELTQLPKFLYAFHAALRVLQIEGIKPLEGYKVLREYSIEQDRLNNQKLWSDTSKELTASLLKIRGNTDDIRLEPPFILVLKALLSVLGKRWAEKWKNRV